MNDPDNPHAQATVDRDLHRRIATYAARVRDGDIAAGNHIVRLLDRPLRVKLRQKIPEGRIDDVYQETWARFFDHLLKGKQPDNYVAWFLGIARLVHLELIRQENKTTELDDRTANVLRAVLPTMDRAAYAEQMRRKLLICLEQMPDRYSHFLIGYATGDERSSLCNRLDLAIGNFNRFLYRARKRLLACLGDSPDNLETV